MKYRLGSLTIEAIDTYVRVSINGDPERTRVTKKQCPEAIDVVSMVAEMRGYYPDRAVQIACSRAAEEARNNKIELDL